MNPYLTSFFVVLLFGFYSSGAIAAPKNLNLKTSQQQQCSRDTPGGQGQVIGGIVEIAFGLMMAGILERGRIPLVFLMSTLPDGIGRIMDGDCAGMLGVDNFVKTGLEEILSVFGGSEKMTSTVPLENVSPIKVISETHPAG